MKNLLKHPINFKEKYLSFNSLPSTSLSVIRRPTRAMRPVGRLVHKGIWRFASLRPTMPTCAYPPHFPAIGCLRSKVCYSRPTASLAREKGGLFVGGMCLRDKAVPLLSSFRRYSIDRQGKETNVNPNKFKPFLNKRIKDFYNFSYKLNKVSKNNSNLIYKSIPYLAKGLSIKEIEKILKLPSLARKGFDSLSFTPKATKSFLFSNTRVIPSLKQANSKPTSSKESKDVGPKFNLKSLKDLKLLGLKNLGQNPACSNASRRPNSPLITDWLPLGAMDRKAQLGLTVEGGKVASGTPNSREGLGPLPHHSAVGSITNHVVTVDSEAVGGLTAESGSWHLREPNGSRGGQGCGVSYGLAPTTPCGDLAGVCTAEERLEVIKGKAERSEVGLRLALAQGIYGRGGRVKGREHANDCLRPKTEITKDPLLRKWEGSWAVEKNKYNKLGIYQAAVSDQKWFSSLEKKRLMIYSAYGQKELFSSLLSGSQSVSYVFNKDYKKINFNSVYKILKYFFKSVSSLISKPAYLFSPDKVNIRLFYYIIPRVSKIIKERKLKKFIRNKGILYEEKKNRREFRKIMKIFKMKVFIARWKESNNLIRLPNLAYTFAKFIESSSLSLPFPASASPVGTVHSLKGIRPIPFVGVGEQVGEMEQHGLGKNVSVPLSPLDIYKNSLNSSQFLLSEAVPSKTKTPKIGGVNALLDGPLSAQLILKENLNNKSAKTDSLKSLELLKTRNREMLNSTMVSLNLDKLKYLVFILEKALNKTVILDLVRLKYPYHESNILAQVLGLSSGRKNFRQMMRKLLYTATIKNPTKMLRKQNFSIIPSYLSGIKVRLAGRLMTQRVVPRFTVQTLQMGSLARGKINFINSSRFTHKNKRGAFSITVSTSHIH